MIGRSVNDLDAKVDAYERTASDVSLGHMGDPFPSPDEPYAGLPIRQVLRRIERFVRTDIVDPLARLIS